MAFRKLIVMNLPRNMLAQMDWKYQNSIQRFMWHFSCGTLNTYRSAISLISPNKIGEDILISRFLKGVFRLKPTKPKYEVTWDVSVVLNYLKTLYPLDVLSLKDLTLKTITLLALSTAHRAQTLAAIKISNIHITNSGLIIKVSDVIKTSGPGRNQPSFIIPRFVDDPRLCAVSVILKYIDTTKVLRGSSDKLFIGVKKPHKAIGSQTVSRWVKSMLEKSGIDISVFTAHSVRHAVTSTALIKGIDLSAIRRTAGWSKNSEVFARFYNRPIIKEDSFVFTVLKG